ncbi:MAG TPA: sigma-70 family RNA polymerase sigma factor, partial [Longimicrobiales bacterium]|nr:sigma-70 family RNA polymerase sigma factor [Longimicrobiales bacterium]
MSRRTEERSDDALVRAAGSGDRDALGELYVRHRGMVYELCLRMVGDPDAAEDLTQEGFLRVERYGSTFDGRSSVRTWLYRLIRNRCIDFLDARRREGDRMEVWKARTERHVEPDVGPDEGARVRRALEELKPEYREVLVLSRYAGMRYREIAEACG